MKTLITDIRNDFTVRQVVDNYVLKTNETFEPMPSDMVKPRIVKGVWIEKATTKEIEEATNRNKAESLSFGIGAIREYIYSNYDKQTQDEDKSFLVVDTHTIIGYSAFKDELENVTTDGLSIELFTEGYGYLKNGVNLEAYIADKPEGLKDRYARLYKITIRLAWADTCERLGKQSLISGIPAKYPPFPKFGGV